jgi:hypothetical protein
MNLASVLMYFGKWKSFESGSVMSVGSDHAELFLRTCGSGSKSDLRLSPASPQFKRKGMGWNDK